MNTTLSKNFIYFQNSYYIHNCRNKPYRKVEHFLQNWITLKVETANLFLSGWDPRKFPLELGNTNPNKHQQQEAAW